MRIILFGLITCMVSIPGWSQTDSVSDVVHTNFIHISEPITNVVRQDREASFPGGLQAFRKYMEEHFNYVHTAIENGIEGTIVVKFLIQEDGKVVASEIIRSVHPMIDDEAKKVIASMPDWSPRMYNGRTYPVTIEVPFVIRIR